MRAAIRQHLPFRTRVHQLFQRGFSPETKAFQQLLLDLPYENLYNKNAVHHTEQPDGPQEELPVKISLFRAAVQRTSMVISIT